MQSVIALALSTMMVLIGLAYQAHSLLQLHALCFWCIATYLPLCVIFVILVLHGGQGDGSQRAHTYAAIVAMLLYLAGVGASKVPHIEPIPADIRAQLDVAKPGYVVFCSYHCPVCSSQLSSVVSKLEKRASTLVIPVFTEGTAQERRATLALCLAVRRGYQDKFIQRIPRIAMSRSFVDVVKAELNPDPKEIKEVEATLAANIRAFTRLGTKKTPTICKVEGSSLRILKSF